MVIAWAALRLIDKYETEYVKQKRTVNFSHFDEALREGDEIAARMSGELMNRPLRLSDLEQDEIAEMVDHLPEDFKVVVRMLVYDGLTQGEVGEILGLSQPAVSARFEKARGLLRQMLKPFADARHPQTTEE